MAERWKVLPRRAVQLLRAALVRNARIDLEPTGRGWERVAAPVVSEYAAGGVTWRLRCHVPSLRVEAQVLLTGQDDVEAQCLAPWIVVDMSQVPIPIAAEWHLAVGEWSTLRGWSRHVGVA